MMKVKVFASLMLAGLPFVLAAQSNDDLYFVPKKKAETKKETVAAPKQNSQGTTVYSTSATSTPVVVKDVAGNTRDVDEYNRRYTSRENTFSMQNDTLYIQEKPYSERGEWVNGFEGTQDDYEYAMRIVRFRSPRYAIPVSSPLYWDVVYGAFPSWDWNVYDDGLYAYVFPTYSNPLWWDWRWNWSIVGPRFSFGWGWSSPWYYSSWYSPYWYGGYWGGYWAGYWGPGWHHHHPYYPSYGWGGGWHRGYTDYRPSRYQNYTTSRRQNMVQSGTISSRRSGDAFSTRSAGRVVRPNEVRSVSSSVRPGVGGGSSVRREGISTGSVTRSERNTGLYTRPSTTINRSGSSSYTRPSSTRRSVNYNYNDNNSRVNRSVRSDFGSSSRSGSFSSGGSSTRGSMGGGMRSGGGGGSSRRR